MRKDDYTVTITEEYIEQDPKKLEAIDIEYKFYNKALKVLNYKKKLRKEILTRIEWLDKYSMNTFGYFI